MILIEYKADLKCYNTAITVTMIGYLPLNYNVPHNELCIPKCKEITGEKDDPDAKQISIQT